MKILKLAATLMALSAIGNAAASSTIDIRGAQYTVDTLYHAKVGPGTTQTHLHLTGPSPLHVFYLTVDITTPGVSIRSVCATDKVAGTQRTSAMATSHSSPGVTYFCGTNADFFATSGTATNGSSKVGSPTYSCIVEGEIYKSSNAGYQFTVDTDGIPYVSRLNFYTGTATLGDKVTLFKGVNVASPNNGITIYTPRYWGSANQTDVTGSCHQVTARLVEGDSFTAGKSFRLEVTSEPTTDGDTPIPADGFVIHARGNSTTGCNTGADNFVAALHTGDIVTFDNRIVNAEGKQIVPRTTVSGNPKTVGGGQTLDTEGERGDASSRHPRTGIGYSEDGTKVIMMVVDGRSSISAGVQTSMLGDIMRYAGAWEAVNIDGGGSSTLYIEKLGVRNNCSDGNERAVGNAIFAVLEAPDDNEIAEITFADFRRDVPFMGTYSPTIYAFNKYGRLIDTDLKDFTLSCEAALGTVSADGHSLTATGQGTYRLTATSGNVSASIPVTVSHGTSVAPRYSEILLDNARSYTAELTTELSGESFPIMPTALKWASDDSSVASVDESGTISAHAEGKATITGTADFGTVNIIVNVQIPTQKVAPAVTLPENPWTVNPTGMNSAETNPFENGFSLDYNIKNTRSAKVTIKPQATVYSLPEAIRLRINPGQAKIKNLTLDLRANNSTRAMSVSHKEFVQDSENVIDFAIADIFDINDIGIYPIELTSIAINPGDKASTDMHIDFPGVEAVYSDEALSVGTIAADTAKAGFFTLNGRKLTLAEGIGTCTISDIEGRTVARISASSASLSQLPSGIYILSAEGPEGPLAAKIALR